MELAWFPWQKSLDVKMSLDASRLFAQELLQDNTKENTNGLYHCSFIRSSLFSIPSKNTALIVNLKQIGCLFNRFSS